MAGYSNTPLPRKLGIKAGMAVWAIDAPKPYPRITGPLPSGCRLLTGRPDHPIPFIHLFARDAGALAAKTPSLKDVLDKTGLLWISWIKQSSSLKTDIKEADIRRAGLELGLVDVKICAVDEDWSGLKFIYCKKDR